MTELAKRFGGSLYELAAEEKLSEELLPQLDAVVASFQAEPQYLRLLSTPNLPKKERCGLLQEAFGGQVHPYVVNFLKILCEEGNLRELRGCVRAYRTRYNEDHGILEVTAAAAVPLDEDAKERLRQKLAAMTGKQIDLTVKVDAGVLGGIRLDMDNIRLDGTVRNRLEAMRRAISHADMEAEAEG